MGNSRHSDNGFYGVMISILSFVYLAGYTLFESSPTLSRLSLLTVLAMLCLLALRFIRTGRLAIPHLLWSPLSFTVVVVASMLWASYLPLAWMYGSIAISAILGAVALWLALYNGLSYRTIFWAALVGSVTVIVAAVMNPEQMVDIVARSGGTFNNPNMAAIYLASCAFIIASPPPESNPHYPQQADTAISSQIARAKLVPRLNMAIAAGLICAAVIFTGSRKTLFAVAVFMIYAVIVLIWQARNKHLAKMLLLSGLVLLIAAALVIPNAHLSGGSVSGVGTIQRMLMLREGNEYSGDTRQAMIATGIELWSKKPWFGYGFGQYDRLAPYGTYSHCNYVELLANMGILGMLVYYLFPTMICIYAIKLKRPQHIAALAIIFLSLLFDLTSVSLLTRPNWNMLVLAAFFAESGRSSVFLTFHRAVKPVSELWLGGRIMHGALRRIRPQGELITIKTTPELRHIVADAGLLRHLRRHDDE